MKGPTDPRAWIGEKVRVVLEGEGPTVRQVRGEQVDAPFRAVIKGEVVGWEQNVGGPLLLTLAGYGRVPAEACRIAKWWRPWM